MTPQFNIGEKVVIKLTGENGMVLESYVNTSSAGIQVGYQVRLHTYAIGNFMEHELDMYKEHKGPVEIG